MANPRPPAARRVRALRLGLALASTVIAVGAAEVAVRAFDIGPTFEVVFREIYQLSPNPVLRYELRPGAADAGASISSAGLRDREFETPKPEGVTRILAIGDSVTYGPLDSRDRAWPKQLEGLLNRFDPSRRYEVLNLGVTGYNIDQVAENLAAKGLLWDPDLIIYAYVLNDPQAESVEASALEDLHEAKRQRFEASLGRGLSRLLSRSRLFLLARFRLFSPTEPSDTGPRAADPGYLAFGTGDRRGEYFRKLHFAAEPRKRLEDGLAKLAETAIATPTLIAVFPLFLESDSGVYPLVDVHQTVLGLSADRGLDAEDLAGAFDAAAIRFGRERSVGDFLHPNAFGYAVAATAIFRALDQRGWVEGYAALEGDRGREGAVARALTSELTLPAEPAKAAH